MRIICPYTSLQYATELVLRIEEPNTLFVYTGESDLDYYNLVRYLWAAKETFIIVEHDIVPWPGALKNLWECPFSLCCFNAPSGIGCVGLGCVKYDSKLMEAIPDHLEKIPEDRRSWKILDGALTWDLFNKGQSLHSHTPMISHIHPNRFSVGPLISEVSKPR